MIDRLVKMKNIKDVVDTLALDIYKFLEVQNKKNNMKFVWMIYLNL